MSFTFSISTQQHLVDVDAFHQVEGVIDYFHRRFGDVKHHMTQWILVAVGAATAVLLQEKLDGEQCAVDADEYDTVVDHVLRVIDIDTHGSNMVFLSELVLSVFFTHIIHGYRVFAERNSERWQQKRCVHAISKRRKRRSAVVCDVVDMMRIRIIAVQDVCAFVHRANLIHVPKGRKQRSTSCDNAHRSMRV